MALCLVKHRDRDDSSSSKITHYGLPTDVLLSVGALEFVLCATTSRKTLEPNQLPGIKWTESEVGH
jgi:hypothetical protein